MPLELSLLIGVFFGSIAAIMAFLIIYNEYQKHKFARGRLWKEALSSALVTFIVFLILAILVGYWAFHLSR
jgi:small-conductance mechanosensitive channel